ncbi:hypothetical protein N475_03895 [Pseudoalteromonas luteoviolacea DSM 6061]|uniref:Big-1 domain-containing protein n=2 Tax=Pseudoalteromonas luteoviolacea TaxID=43657 RepID=A0A161ZUP7_9GAMM|nr:hypothetical protein N475_03895 [Pseudoalteromonas luteoviolacea DSM 6061]MBE0385953.1 hypothetical protein [Pseudoalteromonas luteoviolacea DSM 6061]
MFSMRWFSTIFMIFLLTACGGGGSIDRDSSGDGGGDNTDDYALELSLESQSGTSELSVSNPIQVQAKVTKDGQIQVDKLVKFVGDEFSEFNGAESALTNSQGIAVVGIVANSNAGAGTIQASIDVNGETISKSIEYAAAGDGGIQIALTMKDSSGNDINTQNPLAGELPATVMATLTDNGQPISDKIITFTFDELLSTSSNGKIVTNNNGQASFTVNATQQTGAGDITAQYEETTQTLAYVSDGYEFFGLEVYELLVLGFNAQGQETSELSFNTPISIRASLTLNGKAVADAPLTFEVDKALLSSTTNVLKTNSEGTVTVALLENNISGTGSVTANYTTDNDQELSRTFTFNSAGDGGLQMTLTVKDDSDNAISIDNPIDADKPGRVEITVTNNNNPVANGIVKVTNGGKAVTVPSDGEVETQADGKAKLDLIAIQATGLAEIMATFTDPTTGATVSQSYIYHTDGDPDYTPSAFGLTISGKNSSGVETNELSGNSPLTIEATLLQNGLAFSNQRVQFTVNSFGTLDPTSGSVLTNAQGVATIILRDNSVKGAGTITATFTSSSGETVSRNFNFESAGDGGLLLVIDSIKDQSNNDINVNNQISRTNPGTVIASLTQDGSPVPNALVTFTVDNVATMNPQSGRAETNALGQAQVGLLATTVSGVGQVYAEYEGLRTNDVIFHSVGDAVVNDGNYSFDIRLLTGCNEGWDAVRNDPENEIDPVAGGCTEVTSVDSSVIPELFIKLGKITSDGKEIDNQIIEVVSDKGQVLPNSGKVLTDVNGIALLKLQPGDSDGAGTVTVSFDGETAAENFTVGIQELYLQLTANLPASTTPGQTLPELESGDSFIITAKVFTQSDFAESSLYTQPVDVGFSSVCVSQQPSDPLASLDNPVRTQRGVASSTYRASGCKGSDTITASISAADPASYNFFVNDAPVQSLKYVSASNRFIGLPPATGSVAVTSEITFELIDTDNRPLMQKQVEFRFADLTGRADLTTYKGNTDGDGQVKTLIEGGVIPGALVVEACYLPDDKIAEAALNNQFPTCWQSKITQCAADPTLKFCELPDGITSFSLIPGDEQVNAVSSGVILSSGVPDQDSFDAAPATTILNAQNYVGVFTNISVFFGDQFNQLTRDDLAANVLAESGVVGNIDGTGGAETYQCFAERGVCQVQWRAQGTLPFTEDKWENKISDVCDTYQGQPVPCIGDFPTQVDLPGGGTRTVVRGARVTILASTKGQENFHDKPSSDTVTRTNGIFDIGEFQPLNDDLPEAFIDFNQNGVFDSVECDASNGVENDPCEPTLSNGGHNETFLDANNNGLYDGVPADPTTGIYNGLLCGEAAETAGACSKDLVDIRKQFEIVASSDVVYARFVVNKSHISGADCVNPPGVVDGNNVLMPVAGLLGLEATESADYCDINEIVLSDFDGDGNNETEQVTVEIYYSDLYGNSLPEGTTVNITTENGLTTVQELVGTVYASGGVERGKAVVRVTPENAANNLTEGNLIVTFTIPDPLNDGETIVRTKTITIRDNG